MENVLPKYVRPLDSIDDPIVKVEYLDEAVDAFDEKKFKQSVVSVINYMNPKLLENKDVSKDIEIIQMQGSAEIHVTITKNLFSIKAPFLKIADKTNKVPLLRKIAEVNFNPLTLAQINLEGKELWLEYEMPISLCQPNKVYDLLREVCVYADDFDDLFIDKYKAEFYKTPKKTALTPTEKQEVWKQISDILDDYKKYSQFFKDKRWDDYEWDIVVISLLKISNMPYVHGRLRSDLIEYVSNLFDGNIDFNFRKNKGSNFMKKLCDKTEEEIMSNVYHAEQFISLRWRSSEQIIADRLKHLVERVKKYENEKSFFNLSYYLKFSFLKLIYDFTLEKIYKNAIENVLEEVSGMEPDKAAPKLLKVFYAMYNKTLNSSIGKKKQKKQGFFSKLFN